MIDACTCAHRGQDKLHGHGLRVFNALKGENRFRCTACGKERGGDTPKKKEEVTKATKKR